MTPIEVRRELRRLSHLNLHRPTKVDEAFVEQVQTAHAWLTTLRGRWRILPRRSLYSLRHTCENDLNRGMSDAAVALAAMFEGWEPYHFSPCFPTSLKLRRGKTKA